MSYAVIYLPDFELQAALRLEPELHSRPVALLEDEPAKPVVFQLTEAARRAGIAEGLTSTQAMARCREVILKTRSRPQEEAASETLWQCAYCFSPGIEATAPGVCTLDLTGLPIADDQWAKWAQNILDTLGHLGLRAQIGFAPTPHLAWQAARRAASFLQVENAEEFIGALPIAVWGFSGETLDILEAWGIRTVSAFLALGKEKVAERLGVEAVEMFDLALVQEGRPLKRIVPAESFVEAMDFEEPLESLEPLLFILRRFIEQLTRRLEVVYRVAGEIQLQLGLSSGETYQRKFVIPSPTCEVETLFRMLRAHLENVRTESPIGSLRLSAKPARAASYQFGLFEVALRDPNQFHETLARLTAFLGPNCVGTPRRQETHRPDSFAMNLDAIATGTAPEEKTETTTPLPGLALRRFRPPLPAIVEVRENKPALLRSSPFTGPLAHVNGPWRVSGRWWDNQAWGRDEWEVQTRSGELFRLFQENEQWFVDGIFD